MAIRDLPNMYALSPLTCGPQASGIHIRQIPHGHVTTIACVDIYVVPVYVSACMYLDIIAIANMHQHKS